MELVEDKISLEKLKEMSSHMFGNLVKAVVDVEKDVLVVDAELHADQETFLLDRGSEQNSLWGINIYPERKKKERVEFDSMINLRPNWGNNSRGVEDKEIQKKIVEIVNSKIEE